MKTKQSQITMEQTVKKLGVWAVVVGAILSIPYLTNAPWTARDYIFASAVLFGSATTYELVTRNMANKSYRVAVAIAVITFVLLVWAWAVDGP